MQYCLQVDYLFEMCRQKAVLKLFLFLFEKKKSDET